MLELYLISLASNLHYLSLPIAILSGLILVIILVFWTFSDENDKKRFIKTIKGILICFIISSFLAIFIPNSKQMVIIYGIGGTIDYIKSNETAKQLPDKCIKALDLYIEKQIEDSK